MRVGRDDEPWSKRDVYRPSRFSAEAAFASGWARQCLGLEFRERRQKPATLACELEGRASEVLSGHPKAMNSKNQVQIPTRADYLFRACSRGRTLIALNRVTARGQAHRLECAGG
jgi:hypothetical protein